MPGGLAVKVAAQREDGEQRLAFARFQDCVDEAPPLRIILAKSIQFLPLVYQQQ